MATTALSSPDKPPEKNMNPSKEHVSPTRVVDFPSDQEHGHTSDDTFLPQPTLGDLKPSIPDISSKSLYRNQPAFLATIEDNSSASSAESNSNKRRVAHEQGRQHPEEIGNLPLDLDEVAEDEEQDDEPSEMVSPRTRPRRSSFVANDGDGKHPQSREARAIVDAHRLKDNARTLASLGKEPEALRAYGRALRSMRSEMDRIQKQLEFAGETPTLTARLSTSSEQAASTVAEIQIAMAILYERLGDYDKATKSCHEARQVYSRLEGSEIAKADVEAHQARMDVMLSSLVTARDSFMDRKSMYEEMIQKSRRMMHTRDKTVCQILYEEVVRLVRNVLDKECECLGEGHPQVADTLGILARVYKGEGEIDVAIDEQEAAVAIFRIALGPFHPRTSTATRELGRLFETRFQDDEDLNRAIELYEKAIAGFRKSHGNHFPVVGAILNDIAVIHIRRKEYDQASAKLSDALISYESAIESRSGVNPDVSQVWKNMGKCYSLRGEWDSALFAYKSALRVQRDACRCQDTADTKGDGSKGMQSRNGVNDVSIADTLSRLASVTAMLAQYEDAIGSYEEALQLYRSWLDDASKRSNGKPTQDMVDMQDKVAHTLFLIAEVREKNKDYEQAMTLYSEALALRLTNDAQRDEQRANMVHCAMNLSGIGSVHMRKGEFTEACLVLKESIKFLEAHGVPKDHKIYVLIQERLRVAESGFLRDNGLNDNELDVSTTKSGKTDKTARLEQKAARQVQEGDYDGAIGTLTTALAIRRNRLTKRRMNSVGEKCTKEENEVAMTLERFAKILELKGENDQAVSLYKEATQMHTSNELPDKDA